jgi:hypothetical protein
LSYFLAFPSGTIDVPVGEDNDATSRQVGELLINEPWVQYRAHHVTDQYTQWTVMERDSHGNPTRIMCQQFDGTMSMLSNDPGDSG